MSKQDLTHYLDKNNQIYFNSLYQRFNEHTKSSTMKIFEKDLEINDGDIVIYPTAIASQEMLNDMHVYSYQDLVNKKGEYLSYVKNIHFWPKKMQAGTGSSLERTSYLADIHNVNEEDVIIGAKGTDLFINVKDPKTGNEKKLSLAEIQILQSIVDAEDGSLKKISLHDVTGPETKKSIDAIWKMPCFLDQSKTYQEYIQSHPKIEYFSSTFQDHLPTIDQHNQLTTERKAPGGHGFFGVDALLAALNEDERPNIDASDVLISSIGNGEDLSSTPDEIMLGFINKENIPITMVTTTKTAIDLKGGQIAMAKTGNREPYVTIFEKAQAETSNQLELFEQLGLRNSDNIALFNTNMAIINYNALIPKLKKLIDKIGQDKFLSSITPDLIKNVKKQISKDGKEKTFTQLEGAMGSSLLNLDKAFRQYFNEGLISFINVEQEYRTQFFCPIKTAFDFLIQFHSDRFTFNPINFRLINNNTKHLPAIDLKHSFYKDLKNTLHAFKRCKLKDLTKLTIDGVVFFDGHEFTGENEIFNHHGPIELKQMAQIGTTLKNHKVVIKSKNEIEVILI